MYQLQTKITSLIDKHAPLKVFKIDPMKINWLTKELKEEIEVQNKMKTKLESMGGRSDDMEFMEELPK